MSDEQPRPDESQSNGEHSSNNSEDSDRFDNGDAANNEDYIDGVPLENFDPGRSPPPPLVAIDVEPAVYFGPGTAPPTADSIAGARLLYYGVDYPPPPPPSGLNGIRLMYQYNRMFRPPPPPPPHFSPPPPQEFQYANVLNRRAALTPSQSRAVAGTSSSGQLDAISESRQASENGSSHMSTGSLASGQMPEPVVPRSQPSTLFGEHDTPTTSSSERLRQQESGDSPPPNVVRQPRSSGSSSDSSGSTLDNDNDNH